MAARDLFDELLDYADAHPAERLAIEAFLNGLIGRPDWESEAEQLETTELAQLIRIAYPAWLLRASTATRDWSGGSGPDGKPRGDA